MLSAQALFSPEVILSIFVKIVCKVFRLVSGFACWIDDCYLYVKSKLACLIWFRVCFLRATFQITCCICLDHLGLFMACNFQIFSHLIGTIPIKKCSLWSSLGKNVHARCVRNGALIICLHLDGNLFKHLRVANN